MQPLRNEILLPDRVRAKLGHDVQMDTKCFDARLRNGEVVKGVLVIGGAAIFGTVVDPETLPQLDPNEIIAIRNWGGVSRPGFFKRWKSVE